MGVLDWLGLGSRSLAVNSTSGVLSPWAPEPNFGTVVISESFGLAVKELPLDRSLAMSIPAVARGRHLLVSTVAPLPLVALNADGPLAVQPTWLYRSDTAVSPAERTARTVDSLIFYGQALWAVARGAQGQITDAVWVPHHRWDYDYDSGEVSIDGEVRNPKEYLYFQGWNEGLLSCAARTLRGAIAIENAWVDRVKNPIPTTVIRHEGSDAIQLEQFEIDDLLQQWREKRNAEGGALGYLPPGLAMDALGSVEADLFDKGRAAIRVDIAAFLGLSASMLDGSSGDSLTYSTQEGQRSRYYTETLPLYLNAIEACLSQDRSVPRGTRVRFDLTELYTPTPAPTGAPVED